MAANMDFLEHHSAYSDSPPFLISYMRYQTLFKDLTEKVVSSDFMTIREFLQYVHHKRVTRQKPSTGDAHKDITIVKMALSEVAAVDRGELEEYLWFLDCVVNNSTSTIKRKLSQLRSFFQYLYAQQEELGITMDSDPCALIKNPVQAASKLNIMSKGEINRLLEHIDGENKVRDYAMILLILSSGISISDVVNLTTSDYDGQNLTLRGKKTRSIRLPDGCIRALERYLLEYRSLLDDLHDDALFVSCQHRKGLTLRRIQYIIERHVAAAGLSGKGFSAQDLRDTAIANILRNTPAANRSAVFDLLGHSYGSKARKRFDSVQPAPELRSPSPTLVIKDDIADIYLSQSDRRNG